MLRALRTIFRKKIGCSARSAPFFREIEKIGCSARFFREIEKIEMLFHQYHI